MADRAYRDGKLPSRWKAREHIAGLKRGWIYGAKHYDRAINPKNLETSLAILAIMGIPSNHNLIAIARELAKHEGHDFKYSPDLPAASNLPLEKRTGD